MYRLTMIPMTRLNASFILVNTCERNDVTIGALAEILPVSRAGVSARDAVCFRRAWMHANFLANLNLTLFGYKLTFLMVNFSQGMTYVWETLKRTFVLKS